MEEENQLEANSVRTSDALPGRDHDAAADPNSNSLGNPASTDSQPKYMANSSENAKHNTANGFQKPTALSEVDPNSVSLADDASSKEWSRSEADTNPIVNSKYVSIAEPADEETTSNPNIEQVLPEGEENQEPEDNEGTQFGVKRKKKRKPKSKRGLVLLRALYHKYCTNPDFFSLECPSWF